MSGSFLDTLSDEERALLRRQRHPDWIQPMLATLTERRFSDPDWIFERKLDGVRGIAFRHRRKVRLLSRNRLDMGRYSSIVDALGDQPAEDFVVDGEVVAFRGRRSGFSVLQQLGGGGRVRIVFSVFDLMHLDGYDLTGLPTLRRKALLRAALRFDEPIRYLPHRREHGERYHREACEKGWEGVIAKRGSAPYAPGRSGDWLKLKCVLDQEFAVGGFTEPKGSRTGLGAVLVGYFEDGDLVYAGKVGTGFNQELLSDLRRKLGRLERATPPFTRGIEHLPAKDVHWVRPALVAQVGFAEWTHDGRLRHPRFLGLRRDKDAREVVRERPEAAG